MTSRSTRRAKRRCSRDSMGVRRRTMRNHVGWRPRMANALAYAAYIYVSILIAMLILKATAQQPEVPRLALLGVAAAMIALILAGVLCGAVRSALPAVAAYAIVGFFAERFTRSLSRALAEGSWLFAALLIGVAISLACVSVIFGQRAKDSER
jgi:hypothetical protein